MSAQVVRIDTGTVALSCLVWPDDGPTALLLHGNGGHAHWWDALVPGLAPGWRLVAPDLRGHGESVWADPPRYAIADFASDVDAVLDALTPGPVALVGHSMGARVAAWYAARRPERVRGLALLDTRTSPVDPETVARWRGHVAGRRKGRGYATYDHAVAAFRFVPDEPGVAADVVANLAHHAVRERGPGDWTFRFDRAVLALEGDGVNDLGALLPRIRCPTLVLAGADSWVMDATERAAIVAAIPGAAVRVFPGGHHFFLAQPAAVAAELRGFLDSLPARASGR